MVPAAPTLQRPAASREACGEHAGARASLHPARQAPLRDQEAQGGTPAATSPGPVFFLEIARVCPRVKRSNKKPRVPASEGGNARPRLPPALPSSLSQTPDPVQAGPQKGAALPVRDQESKG